MDAAEPALTSLSKGIVKCPEFARFEWLEHGFGTRDCSPHAEVTLRQIHSNQVWDASRISEREKEGDALVTDKPRLSIGVRTADCVPILLVDARTQAVAAIHAGWRGSVARITQQAIARMRTAFAGNVEDLYAAIGPCIRRCCYEVSEDVARQFAEWEGAVDSSQTKPRVDLARANFCQMVESGVRAERIFDLKLCTACRSDLFFSFRREPKNPGRMLSMICRL